MKKLSLFQWLLLLPAFLLLLVSLAVSGLVLMFAPPVVSWVAGGLLAVVLVWFFFARSRGTSGASEYSFLRQSSKEGLL
jgi:uncharacterized membrane protein YesL